MVESSATYPLGTTPFELIDLPTVTAIVEAAENVTPVYAYFEDYLLNQINTLKRCF
jgi:hypothetical protein